MNRKQFIRAIAFLPFLGTAMKLQTLKKITNTLAQTEPMPILFLGHGSPMNAIEENQFVQGFRNVAKRIPKPTAILCISAHWETKGTYITAMEYPKTIHDFGGFPQDLYDVQYPAKGSPQLAQNIQNIVTTTQAKLTDSWGLDHGAWSVIKHMYPQADVPTIQMSIDHFKNAQFHYNLGKELKELRKKGVLIIGSGNIIHNLSLVAWNKINEPQYGFDWAIETDNKIKEYILKEDHQALINFNKQGKGFQLAIPTPEHYLPLLYILGLQEKNERISVFNDLTIGGSLSMTSVLIERL